MDDIHFQQQEQTETWNTDKALASRFLHDSLVYIQVATLEYLGFQSPLRFSSGDLAL